MKCDKCGATPNPGDQVCINCGAKLSLDNAIVRNVESVPAQTKKSHKSLYLIGGIILVIVIIVVTVVVTMFVIKR